MIILLLLLVAAIISAADDARAQGCCTVGASTLGGLQSGVLRHGSLTVAVNYQFNSLTKAYLERDRIPDPQRRTASVAYFAVMTEFGFQPKLSLLASLPFADKTREITVTNALSRFDETATFSASGLGDVLVLMKYQIISPSIVVPLELAIGGGASLPTGSFTREQTNAQLSIDLQPGSGATAVLAWAFLLRSFPQHGLHFNVDATYRYSGTNFDGYRFGDEYNLTLGGGYSIDEHFESSVHFRSRFAMQDYVNRRTLSATGGTFHDLVVGVSYVDGSSRARVFGQLPVYRNVRGIQLALSYMIGVEYGYTFDFSDGPAVQ